MSKEQPIFGIDVHSEYQHGLNFERARAEGYEFCVIKAAEGPYRDGDKYVPTGFKEFFRRAEAEGFVMGVYAFLLSTPAKEQADHFLRTIEAVGGPEDKILMVDFEDYLNYPALTPGNEQLEDFIADVKRRVGDHPIVVYSGRGFWNGGDSSGDFDQYGADVAWDAYYLHMDPVRPKQFYANSEQYFQDAGIPWGWGKPWGGVEPWFWQFTSAGSVAGMNIDVNAYKGTSEQLLALTGVKERGGAGDGGAGDLGARDGETRGGGTSDGKRRVLTHGVIDGTNFAEGYKYIMQLNNRMKYWVWSSGPVPEGEGAYAVDRPLPPVDQLKGKRIFCAGVPNIIRRAAGRSIPTRGNALYDGGVAAYFYTSAFGGLGPGFFSGVDVPFHLATAKKWARETGSGVLVGRSYRNTSLAGQGHVAILLPDGKVLQSFQFGADGEPGLNSDYTMEESHAGGYYEIMVHPKDWINHDKGRDDKERDERERDEKERDEKRRRERTDEEPYRPEPVQEFTDEEFEEIGREVLKLFSRLRQNSSEGDVSPRGREQH